MFTLRHVLSILFFVTFVSKTWAIDPALIPGVDPGSLKDAVVEDSNRNGVLELAAFGDSITFGIGDEVGPERGYPLRLEQYFAVGVTNLGDPGEKLTTEGVRRYIQTIPGVNPDLVTIGEGTNDAFFSISSAVYQRSVQMLINYTRGLGAIPVLVTAPPACCGRVVANNGAIKRYNEILRSLAAVNAVPLAEVNQAFRNSCPEIDQCNLIDTDGIHPNSLGYDIMGEVVSATYLGIDLLAEGNATKLEKALRLPEGSVKTLPTVEG
ncbi:SGNH/GDSL hydrolase family protein [bacterium]|nr:SGNH/GDSL hydrolase family protein [bacterium]